MGHSGFRQEAQITVLDACSHETSTPTPGAFKRPTCWSHRRSVGRVPGDGPPPFCLEPLPDGGPHGGGLLPPGLPGLLGFLRT